MPVEVTYPGVYIEELESTNHSMVPVATNIAAFIGRALYGSTTQPITINSYGDFQKLFGGLQFDYPMSYAVQDFFTNGGSQAVIARLFEPTTGDGSARLHFPPAPPAVPDGWLVDADASKGGTKVAVAPPDDTSESEPVEGMTFKLDGDNTDYTVTAYSGKTDKAPAQVTIVPKLTADFRKCTKMTFSQGPSPQGWTGAGTGSASVTLTGGKGIPELGDVVSFTGDTSGNTYVIIANPEVSGDKPSNLTLKLTLSAKPTSAFGPVSIDQPTALPMPIGWEIEAANNGSSPDQATLDLINGDHDPLAGDQFTIGNDETTYAVNSFTAATAKAPASMAITRMDGNPVDLDDFCLCCKPIFARKPPTGATIKKGASEDDTSFTVTQPEHGTIDIGDTFTVDGDETVYNVRYIDGDTIYFLPQAKEDWTGSDITFYPALTLKAANPGLWGNRLTAKADTHGITDQTAEQFNDEYDIEAVDLFNLTLTLYDAKGNATSSERYLNLSVSKEGQKKYYPNRVDKVLQSESALALVDELSGMPPGDGQLAQGTGGNDGQNLKPTTYLGNQSTKTGMYLLEKCDMFNLLCIPPDHRLLDDVPQSEWDLDAAVRAQAAIYATDRRAFYIVDPLSSWSDKAHQGLLSQLQASDLGITGKNTAGEQVERNCAVYFPRIIKEDLKMKSRPALFAACGAVAGVMASTDVSRGVWKAPAGQNAGIGGITKLELPLSNAENGELNPKGINCLRSLATYGPVVWGARTLRGADAFEDAYKYIPVRRLTLYIEDTLFRSTQWAVFEPNNEALWSSLRLQVSTWLADLTKQGALYNYSVQCDAKNNTAETIEEGKVIMTVGIAPVDPAEFVILQIQQTAPTV
ncbi:phage tail sheath C-terminal domain-containing protein [uncultured Erythrobacter sp.]|uniref:phage tail sheath C-terminal domain-containing protein n=1 Tax=uncultured Erythrobacter sp. TaxID=263913 RepID=UPI002628822B|nr:phage tail sheath C-terminal domain-containing protein [uncultured Erythrobacter sp.]